MAAASTSPPPSFYTADRNNQGPWERSRIICFEDRADDSRRGSAMLRPTTLRGQDLRLSGAIKHSRGSKPTA
jgi:hypothetical protein